MEQKEKKILFLSNLFQHLDGIALIPTIIELQRKEILNKIKTEKKQTNATNQIIHEQTNALYQIIRNKQNTNKCYKPNNKI